MFAGGICGDLRGAIAGGGVGMHRMRIGLDDLTGDRINQPALAVEDGDDDRAATGGALAFLAGHGFHGFEARGAVGTGEAITTNAIATDIGYEAGANPLWAIGDHRRAGDRVNELWLGDWCGRGAGPWHGGSAWAWLLRH